MQINFGQRLQNCPNFPRTHIGFKYDANKKTGREETEVNLVPSVSLPPVPAKAGRKEILETNFH